MDGENHATATLRELSEELGIDEEAVELGAQLAERDKDHLVGGRHVRQVEKYVLTRVSATNVDPDRAFAARQHPRTPLVDPRRTAHHGRDGLPARSCRPAHRRSRARCPPAPRRPGRGRADSAPGARARTKLRRGHPVLTSQIAKRSNLAAPDGAAHRVLPVISLIHAMPRPRSRWHHVCRESMVKDGGFHVAGPINHSPHHGLGAGPPPTAVLARGAVPDLRSG
ncbi:hypothetical protein [Streptomyces olivaceoviridis]|uniref:hypothetical protein n=1 Tax=Streptomyces olivaceoviridis TaxID=1921 RepID=UPI001E4849DB|nr:hypothetical protein [Streptomyces olivaceoviridis]